jgi:hypothetical protein
LCGGDIDCDGVLDAQDNCVLFANPDQRDSDAYFDNGPDIGGVDDTVPNGDGLGDACVDDDDNDGLTDAFDGSVLAGCGGFNGVPAGHSAPSGGDYTTADVSGLSRDTDDDAVPDGMECLVGTNPRAASADDRAACAAAPGVGDDDTDADGLLDLWELCKWGSSPASTDTDQDGLGDCLEAFDVNGNEQVNAADGTLALQAFFGMIARDWVFDANANGVITTADGTLIRQAAFGVLTCL